MPTKKRRASQSAEGKGDDDPSVQGPVSKKKKKVTVHYDPAEICQDLYDAVRNHKAGDGRYVCEAFIRVPKRRTEPEYYNAVSNPIDMLKIQHKLKSEEYDDIDQLTADIELMISNAKAYYKKSSQEYIDACELLDLFTETKRAMLSEVFGGDDDVDMAATGDGAEGDSKTRTHSGEEAGVAGDSKIRTRSGDEKPEDDTEPDQEDSTEGEEKSAAGGDDDDSVYEQLFSSVVTAREGDRNVSEMFRTLPTSSKYPEYYQVIKEPMDLKTIAQKIQCNEYSSLDEMIKDLNVMVNNARMFNEPGSQIYRDAQTIKKVLQTRKQEIEQSKSQRLRSERIRLKKQLPGPKLSAVLASLPNESEDDDVTAGDSISQMGDIEEESGAEGSVMESDDDPFWALYNAVKFFKDPLGNLLSEPFLRLPSKRIYPDYYEEIKKTLCLIQIHKKMKGGRYKALEDLASDFDLMFENAKQYNVDESKIYKDAVKLHSVMRAKKRELLGLPPQDLSEHGLSSPYLATKPTHPSLEVVPPPIPLETYLKEEGFEIGAIADITMKPTNITKTRRNLETASTTSEESTAKKKPGRKVSLSPEEQLKNRLWLLYNTIFEYQVDNRYLINIFITLPSKKDYPDYYLVISEPIDMTMIENKIKAEKYHSEIELMEDFGLMFSNARHYNEENSQVYRDALTLETVLKEKLRTMGPVAGSPSSKAKSKPKSKVSPLFQKLQDLHNTIKDYTDSRGRFLSTPFMKLPARADYPDYYEVIRRPVDMQKVHLRMTSGQYSSVEDMVSDFVLMFDNACKYNEPDSLIYKDALTLQRVCLEKKQQLCSDDNTNEVPDVKAAVQELMTNLFISTYNHTDEEGRCLTDSFLELPTLPVEEGEKEKEDTEQPVTRKLTFEQIKRNLDGGRYRRVDRFQEDMFEVFEGARKASRTDSQLYEDSVELQMFFMKIRDELCKNGEHLLTPALSYTDFHLNKDLEVERREKLPKEQKDDDDKRKQDDEGKKTDKNDAESSEMSVVYKEQTYHIGDFVYIEPREKGIDFHIVCIEKLWQDETGEQWLHGNWFYRPNETYHLATRKFLEKEVFKSDFYDSIPFSKVLGKCFVMSVKEYFKMKPEGVENKDTFVCESRYSSRQKSFKKIKWHIGKELFIAGGEKVQGVGAPNKMIWQSPKNEHVKLVTRETALTPVRVASVFAEQSKSTVDERTEIEDWDMQLLDKKREVVLVENASNAAAGCTYYEQLQGPTGWFKLGDYVYVKSEDDRPIISRMDKIWTHNSGEAYFHGPFFMFPPEVVHQPTRMFYKHEVFRSSTEDTNDMASIIGHCAILSYKDYCSSRPTEIAEEDVYICESKYVQEEKVIKKLNKPLKKHALSIQVCDDEVYFFKKPIIPHKEPSPLLMKASEESVADYTYSLDQSMSLDATYTEGYNTSFSGLVPQHEDNEEPPVEQKEKKERKKSSKKGHPSGYIVFAGECRKDIQNMNPDMSFGDISKVVGEKWRNLPKEEKEKYAEKAKKISEEMVAKQEAADRALNESLNKAQMPRPNQPPGQFPPGQVPPQQMQGAYPPQGFGPQPGYPQYPGSPYSGNPQQQGPPGVSSPGPQGMPQQGMMPQQGLPHPAIGMHPRPLMTSAMGGMMPQGPHPGYLPGLSQPQITSTPLSHRPGVMMSAQRPQPPPPPARPPSPMFVSVPPRTQRLLHSEAYLRYIEGLKPDSRGVGDWEKSLTGTPENTPLSNNGKLPVHWLAQGVGHHDNAVNALWALRDLMMKDVLTLSRTLEFNQLW